MSRKTMTFAALGLVLITALPVSSSELSYTNLSIGYQTQSDDELGFNLDSDGIRFDGSLALSDGAFLRADYFSLRSDTVHAGRSSYVVDSSRSSIGLGYHFPVAVNTDLVGTLSYGSKKKDFLNTSKNDEGYIVSGGIRSKLAGIIELDAELSYVDIGGKEDVGYGVTGRVFIMPDASIGLSFDKLDNSDKFTVDLRYDF